MQQVIDDQLRISIPFLGGINEQADVLELPLEEFKSSVGTFPQFSGMLARLPGKVAISYQTSPVRTVHQSFSGGSFCFYVITDRVLLYNECRNPSYTVKPTPPADLGTTEDGRTLDVFGGFGNVPVGTPDLSFSPKCIPQGTAPTPDPDPGSGDIGQLTLLTDTLVHTGWNLRLRMAFESSATSNTDVLVNGVDFTEGPGESVDFTALINEIIADFPGDPLVLVAVFEVAPDNSTDEPSPIEISNVTPPGAIEVTSFGGEDCAIQLVNPNQWNDVVATLQIVPPTVVGQFTIQTDNFDDWLTHDGSPTAGDEIEIDWVYQSGTVFQGPQFIKDTDFTTNPGDVIEFTDQILGALTFFGSPLVAIRIFRRDGATKYQVTTISSNPIENPPSSVFRNFYEFPSNAKCQVKISDATEVDWTDIIQLQLRVNDTP